MRRSVVWSLSILAALAGCGGAADDSAEPATRTFQEDGVRVVESAAPVHSDAEGWAVEAEPLVTIGVAEGEEPYMLSAVHGAVLLPDGGVLMADRSNELRIFDAAGSYVRTFGRPGSGPCEFEFIAQPRVADGNVVVQDFRQRRASVMSLEGECLETFPIQLPDFAGGEVVGRFGDGDLLLRGFDFEPPPEPEAGELPWRRQTLLRWPWQGGLAPETLLTARWTEMSPGGAGMGEMLHFASRASVSAAGDRLFVSEGERYEISVYDGEGEPVMRMRRSDLPPEVTEEMIARFRDKSLENIAAHDGDRENPRTRLASAEFADRVPGYRLIHVDDAGRVWARLHLGLPDELPFVFSGRPREEQMFPPPEAVAWDVYGADGTWLATVGISSDRHIMDVRGDRVLMSGMDAAGIPRIWIHQLRRGTSNG